MNPVKIEIAAGIMTVTLADVENRNALGGALVAGLREALANANADPAVRVVVLTNEGTTFCAGANLKERSGAKSQAKNSGGFDDLLADIPDLSHTDHWAHQWPCRWRRQTGSPPHSTSPSPPKTSNSGSPRSDSA